ncbi:MAG: hypothetical protein R3B91_22955 [Planctomycetaceae bacterium]
MESKITFMMRSSLSPESRANRHSQRQDGLHPSPRFLHAGRPCETGLRSNRTEWAALFGENIEELRIQYADLLKKEEAAKKSGQHVHHHDGIPDIQKEVTALLVLTKAPTASIFLTSKLKEGVIAQAVNPVFVMQQLMQNLVGNVRYRADGAHGVDHCRLGHRHFCEHLQLDVGPQT